MSTVPPNQNTQPTQQVPPLRPSRREQVDLLLLLTGIALGLVLLIVGFPAVALLWRSVLADEPDATGFVAGALLLVGMFLAAGGIFALLLGDRTQAERAPTDEVSMSRRLSALVRPWSLVTLLGVLVLGMAALVVS